MITKNCFLIIFISVSSFLFAQCPPGDVLIQSQTDLANFANTYPDCEILNGDLIIRSNDTIVPQVNDLSLLPRIKSCGRLGIYNNRHLKSLVGLDSLSMVGLGITISNNDSLRNLEGLERLVEVKRNFEILSNDLLINLEGIAKELSIQDNLIIGFNDKLGDLSALADIDNTDGLWLDSNAYSDLNFLDTLVGKFMELRITSNSKITSLEGLDKIKTLDGLTLIMLDSLNDISALSNLTSLRNGGLALIGLSSLESLESLSNLEFVRITFFITGLPKLTDLKGLENLVSITRDFVIRSCENLENLNHLNPDLEIGDELYLTFNKQLQYCTSEAICNHLSENRPAIINNNADQCNSRQEILDACTSTTLIENNRPNIQHNFHVNPIPSNGSLNLSYDFPQQHSYKLIIFNSAGQRIKSIFPLPNTIQLTAGIYFLVVQNEENILPYKKVVIVD